MSDNSITIKKLLDLDESIFTKMSDITVDAVIKEAKSVYERKVKTGKRKGETFWSQKVVIDDGTGSIVLDLITNKAEDAVPRTAVGKKIRVQDAKADIYKDERRLARGKVSFMNGQRAPSGSVETSADGYYIIIGPNGKVLRAPAVEEREQRLIAGQAVAKSLIEAGRKWNKATQNEFDGWLGKIYGSEPKDGLESKPQEKKKSEATKQDEFDKLNDPDFDRNKLIRRLSKRFAELFVSKKTKGLGLEEWLTKNYEVKAFAELSDDYLVKIDSVFDDMFEELAEELGGK